MAKRFSLTGPLRSAAAHFAQMKAATVRAAVAEGKPGVVVAAAGADSRLARRAALEQVTEADIMAWSAAEARRARRRAQRIAVRGRAAARAALASVLLLLALLLPAVAGAAPPEPGSRDWHLLAPFSAWVEGLMDSVGRSCCSIADCRPVDARMTAEGWEVRWQHDQKVPGAPTAWTKVPAEALLATENRTGVPVACWRGSILCFVPPTQG